jgi:hypothetical protein
MLETNSAPAQGLSTGHGVLTLAATVAGSVIGALVTNALSAPWWVVGGSIPLLAMFSGLWAYYSLLLRSASSDERRVRQD